MKAYDFAVLADKLKAKGLDLAEDAAKIVASEVLDWVQESAQISDNKFDDLAAAVIPVVKPKIFEAIDLIDGQNG